MRLRCACLFTTKDIACLPVPTFLMLLPPFGRAPRSWPAVVALASSPYLFATGKPPCVHVRSYIFRPSFDGLP